MAEGKLSATKTVMTRLLAQHEDLLELLAILKSEVPEVNKYTCRLETVPSTWSTQYADLTSDMKDEMNAADSCLEADTKGSLPYYCEEV